jgi:hypothetical protein
MFHVKHLLDFSGVLTYVNDVDGALRENLAQSAIVVFGVVSGVIVERRLRRLFDKLVLSRDRLSCWRVLR